jgi:hypothetical protein
MSAELHWDEPEVYEQMKAAAKRGDFERVQALIHDLSEADCVQFLKIIVRASQIQKVH